MTTATFLPGPAVAGRVLSAATVARAAAAVLRAVFLASSSEDLDACGVLRTAEANRRRVLRSPSE